MEYFNIYGFLFMIIIMIPNIVYAIKCKDDFTNKWNNKCIEFLEQIGRIGCFIFMVINIPTTYFGWPNNIFGVYIIINTILILVYCIIWVICFRKNNLFKALTLSIIPSIVFLFSGITSRYILLTISAIIFAPCHIIISIKNVDR